MQYDSPLLTGKLIKRYKRFLADIELDCAGREGEIITAHCANTGAMTHCADEGCRVWLWDSNNPKRKLPISWEWTTVTTDAGQYKACVNTARANQLVHETLLQQLEQASTAGEHWLAGYTSVRKEPKVEDGRLDFCLHGEGMADFYIEVKSLTLPRIDIKPGLGCFPDARTERGLKHLQRLLALKQQGHRTALLFCVSLEGIEQVAAAADVDPDYAAALDQIREGGVEVMAWPVRFDLPANSMTLQPERALPVLESGQYPLNK